MAASTRALFVAFLAVVAAFIGSTFWAEHAARGIDADTLFISRVAAPRIEVLSDLRGELRNLEIEAGRMVESGDSAQVAATRGRIDALVARALSLPSGPQASELLGRLQVEMRGFDEAVERAMEQARAAANRLAYELDALSAALAVVAAWLAWRTIRQVARVQEESRAIVERRAEELEQFAGRVAHDVLSPLGAVAMSLGIAERSAPQAKEIIARGLESLSRVRRIVDGLLEFARAGARPEPGARAEVQPIVAGLEQELAPFAGQQGAELRIEEVPHCSLACSPGVLLSLLSNLLRNAIKYLGDGAVREVHLRVKRHRGKVLFEVEDTGPGIPSSLGARIFEPYVRGPKTGAPGIGLGLATVKRLVESHGGAVGVRAGPRGGALFWFELDEAVAPGEHMPLPHDERRPA